MELNYVIYIIYLNYLKHFKNKSYEKVENKIKIKFNSKNKNKIHNFKIE